MSVPVIDNTSEMSRTDRESLIKITRQRERVAKSEAKERAAELRADFEKMLDRRYSYAENEVWEKAMAAAHDAVRHAKAVIAEECAALGIPAQFAPDISMGWSDRGRNASKEERAEMRRVAHAEIEVVERKARAAIERKSVETQEAIMVGGLTTESAKLFLESMPTADALMPPVTIERVETLLLA